MPPPRNIPKENGFTDTVTDTVGGFLDGVQQLTPQVVATYGAVRAAKDAIEGKPTGDYDATPFLGSGSGDAGRHLLAQEEYLADSAVNAFVRQTQRIGGILLERYGAYLIAGVGLLYIIRRKK